MKIDNQGKPIQASTLRGQDVRASDAGKSANASAVQENVTLSHSAPAEASFDAAKVSEIRQAISEGRFQVRPEAIADGLLASVKELLER